MDRFIVVNAWGKAKNYLRRNAEEAAGYEWIPERESATRFTSLEARELVALHGGRAARA